MKRKNYADYVGGAQRDRAGKHVISLGPTKYQASLQDRPLTGFVCNGSGLITCFFRSGVRGEVRHG